MTMATLFDAQSDSAALQGDIARLKTAHGKRVTVPSVEPLLHTDHAGNIVDRAGHILIPKLAPIPAPKGK